MSLELEQARSDVALLRRNYEVQMTINQSLTQEIKQKEEQFRQKMGLLEVELKRFMQES